MTNHAILLDLDGTLVDSVYHHVVAWSDAFAAHGYDVPARRIHAGIGMGGDRLVAWLVGEEPDDADDLREAHTEGFLDRVDSLRPTPGALALVDDLERREVDFVVATSASPTEREALLEVLGRPDLPVTDNDASIDSKPAPDLLLDACGMLDADPSNATLVGDAPWDARAAGRVGMRTIAVRCGGFGDEVLTAAGAIDVVDAPRDLVGRL